MTKGFIKSSKNDKSELIQIVVPGSGHMVPSCQPEVSLEMVYNFVFKRDFPNYKPKLDDC